MVANQQRIIQVSGNYQTGAVGTQLAQPLVVELLNPIGQPIPNTQVTFTVGQVTNPGGLPQQGRQITLQTMSTAW